MIANSARPSESPLWLAVGLSLLPFVVIVLAFLILCVHAPLWYDEANYLTLSAAIGTLGYPVWYSIPNNPVLFQTSPPAILYFISFLLSWISSDIVVLRILFAMLFGVTPLVFLAVRAGRKGKSLFPICVAGLFAGSSGVFLMELVQLRFDLPLACLSCLVLVMFVDGFDRSHQTAVQGRRWLLPACLLILSALAFLTKLQAVCLTAALCLDVALAYLFFERRAVRWREFLVHLTGLALAIIAMVWWSTASGYASSGATLSHTIQWNIFDRILPGRSVTQEIIIFSGVAKQATMLIVVPIALLLIASALRKLDWTDRLLRLFVLMIAAVVAFNLVLYRLPGAGNYYMVQAIIPLGYVLGRSLASLHKSIFQRSPAITALFALLILHGVLNLPPVTRAIQPDRDRMVAEKIAPILRSEDLLLLDDERQSRAIPYLLDRFDRYEEPYFTWSLRRRSGCCNEIDIRAERYVALSSNH